MKILKNSLSVAFLTVLALGVLHHAVAQNKTAQPDAKQLGQQLARSVQRAADSALMAERRHADSLVSSVSSAAFLAAKRLELSVNSLVTSAGDSLDTKRQDTLRLAAKFLQQPLLAFEVEAKKLIAGPVSHLTQQITKGTNEYSRCDGCEDRAEFNDRFSEFREYVDEACETFRDTTSTLIDEQKDFIQERHEAAYDSLVTLRDNLIENRLSEIEYRRDVATRLTISTGYSSHTAYRGRDNGLPQQMIAPSLAYRHSSGFGIEASTYWLDQTPTRWDNIAVSASYEFTMGNIIGGGITYSHFWFSDSSRRSEAVFKNGFGASLSLNWPALSLSVNGDLATGDASEFTLAASVSHGFEIPLTLYNKVSIEPTLTATIGEQNGSLTILRTKGVKRKRVIGTETQTNSMFGILDYEVSIPVTVVLGPVTLSPSVSYVIPFNVIDESTTRSFVNFEFGASLTFH